VAIDQSVSPNRIWVADTENNRVLGWSSITAFAAHGPANIVIGQVRLHRQRLQPGRSQRRLSSGDLDRRFAVPRWWSEGDSNRRSSFALLY
jgi:hypothetical protein